MPRAPIAYVRLVLATFVILMCAGGCASSKSPELTYRPAFLPVELTFGTSGISIKGDQSLATPIGEFSIGAHYDLPVRDQGGIYVILRDRKTGYDKIFEVRTGSDQFSVVVNGTTSISVANGQVMIDITTGDIKTVAFKRSNGAVAEKASSGWLAVTGHKVATRWDEGWRDSWYKPFQLTQWSYSDSTIEKWYGVGFVWFLLRLILAIVLFVVDAVMTIGFIVGQGAFILFGPTGRDASYGLMILIVITGGIKAAVSYYRYGLPF